MNRKILIGIGLALILMLSLSGAVLAAPAAQETTPITGTVQSISLETDATTNETTVLVEVLDDTGATQTVRLSVEDAAALDLVTLDPTTGEPTVNDAAVGDPVSIDPSLVIGDEQEEDLHPVGSALSDFFSELLGVDYDTIMGYHEEGVGFGVIAQALWMTNKLEGDTDTFAAILEAKQEGDYSMITLPDGSTPQNWGQFRKAVLQGDKHANLGQIMSGKADSSADSGEDDASTVPSPSLNDDANNNDHGNGNDNDRGNNNDHGKGNNKDHGNGKKDNSKGKNR